VPPLQLEESGQASASRATRNARSVWVINPEPYSAAHFATFPTAIPRRAILAGTSEKGACAECGAPWARVVERQDKRHWLERRHPGGPKTQPQNASGRNDSGHMFLGNDAITTGWQPTCDHEADVVPCVVLDPFAGSGTTMAVAKELSRQSIGIELSADYCKLAAKRIQGVTTGMVLV